jgi:SAM-dependent methyltransferase
MPAIPDSGFISQPLSRKTHTYQVEPEPGSLAEYFAPRPEAAYREIARILPPGGRAVLTNWEPLTGDDQRLPERLRRVDLRAGLTAAGFVNVEVAERPGWRAAERAMWEQAAALDPGDDPALRAFHDDGVRALHVFDLVRRVIAAATAP